VQVRVPSGLCSVVCGGFVGFWVSSYLLGGWMSRSGLIGVVESVRLVNLHPSFVMKFTRGILLLTRRGSCFLCLYACSAAGPFSLSMIVESSCQSGPQCTSYRGLPSMWSNGCMILHTLESLFCAGVYLLLGEYLWSPLGDEVCCLVMEVSVVLYF